jgi:nucleotide-binding universal stress UspA family protein
MLSKPNILVCTDFTTFSNSALKVAEKVRERTDGHLDILHVSEHAVMWDWLPSEGVPGMNNAEYEVGLMNKLRLILERQMESCSVKGEAHISFGDPSSVILQEVLEKKIDLIVIGHKGRTGLNFHFGSVAQKVVAVSPVPVLVIKQEREVKKIACLLDPNEPMKSLLQWSEEMAYLFSSQLTVVSLFLDIAARYASYKKTGYSTDLMALRPEQKEKILSEVRNKIVSLLDPHSKADLRVEVSAEKKLSYHLNSILSDEKIDLAIMKRHQYGFLETLLIGSETRRMLEIFHGNLLILPPLKE